ncbi:MAG: hypothetical protein QM640_06625 [Niabella sp.]
MITPWLLIPFISAIAGWIFNTLIGNYALHRYLPLLKKQFSEKAGAHLETLFPFHKLEEKITDPALIENALPLIEQHIDDFLSVKLPQEIPMLAMFIGNKTTDQVKAVFMIQVKALFPKVMQHIVQNVTQTFNLQAAIDKELNKPDFDTLIKNRLALPLKKLSYSGLLLGFMIGCINLLIFSLLR